MIFTLHHIPKVLLVILRHLVIAYDKRENLNDYHISYVILSF